MLNSDASISRSKGCLVIAKRTTTHVVPACPCDQRVGGCPDNAGANTLEVCNHLNVFVGNQMLEPISTPIRLGARANIRPMDMAMVLDELMQRELLNANSLAYPLQLAASTDPHTASASNSIWRASLSGGRTVSASMNAIHRAPTSSDCSVPTVLALPTFSKANAYRPPTSLTPPIPCCKSRDSTRRIP